MKRIIKFLTIIGFLTGSSTLVAQGNAVIEQDNFHIKILKEMPSLDTFGEYKHVTIKNTDPVTKDAIVTNDDYYKALLQEMPSLDILGEFKYYTPQDASFAFRTDDANSSILEETDYLELVQEMPSLDLLIF